MSTYTAGVLHNTLSLRNDAVVAFEAVAERVSFRAAVEGGFDDAGCGFVVFDALSGDVSHNGEKD